MNAATKPDVLAELRTLRSRFVNCAVHNGSDRAFAETACEGFDATVSAVAELIAATAPLLSLESFANDVEDLQDDDIALIWVGTIKRIRAAFARVQGGAE